MRAERIIQTISSFSEIGCPAAVSLQTETNFVFSSVPVFMLARREICNSLVL